MADEKGQQRARQGQQRARQVEERLRARALADDPRRVLALADVAAWARAEGEGSTVEAEALRRRGFEARIPGLAARPTVIVMGWAISVAVLAASALSWLPKRAWVEAIGRLATMGACAAAVAAAAWGILSEVRGWEGSDASRWLLKRRVKAWRKALDARRSEIGDTLVAVGADAVVVYRIEGEAIGARAYPPAAVTAIVLAAQGEGAHPDGHRDGHMSLRLTTRDATARFDWLRRDPAFATAVERFAARARHAEAPATQTSATQTSATQTSATEVA